MKLKQQSQTKIPQDKSLAKDSLNVLKNLAPNSLRKKLQLMLV